MKHTLRSTGNDQMSAPFLAEKIQPLVKDLPKTAKILDIATGKGYLLPILSSWGFSDISAADINDENFIQDRIKYNFFKIDANRPMPFQEGQFDLIISSETIEHVENPIDFLRQLKSFLKDDGLMIITTPNVQTIFSKLYFLLRGGLAGHQEADFVLSGHITIVTDWLIERFCRILDLKIEKTTYNCAYFPVFRISLRNALINKAFGWITIYKITKLNETAKLKSA
jgi:SAM-dependent methyltransferase